MLSAASKSIQIIVDPANQLPAAYLRIWASADFTLSLIAGYLNDTARCQEGSTYVLFRISN